MNKPMAEMTYYIANFNTSNAGPIDIYQGYPAKRALSAMCKHGG